MKIIIVGGVAGGASAATRARRVNAHAEIIIFEKGMAPSFANCGLPYHLGGEIKERGKLLVATADLFRRRFGIDVRTESEVTRIDREKREIEYKELRTGRVTRQGFDKLILSPGSRLRTLPALNGGFENVFTLWSLNDLDRSLSFIQNNQVNKIAVIGAGFVGLEVAEQLQLKGYKVVLIERNPQVLGPLDPDMASFVAEELTEKGVQLYLGREVLGADSEQGRVRALKLDNGSIIETDLVFVGIGVSPEIKLAQDAGLDVGSGVRVNQYQQTSDPNIYAVGDASEYFYAPTGNAQPLPLAGPANRSGRIAGEHAASGRAQFTQKVFGTAIVRAFNKVAAITGLSEKACTKAGIPHTVAIISAAHHASYFPGAKEMILKLIFDENSGKILGCQAVGEDGVDKRIDVIASVMHFGGTVRELANLDLAYAPPFGSAKDPLHQLAFVALNHMDGRPKLLGSKANLEGYQILDVRTEGERERLPMPGAIALPIDHPDGDIRGRVADLNPRQRTIVICHSGKRAHVVASMLIGLGFSDVANLTGGMMMRAR